ncbi:hypothetical protein A7H1H_1375 [Aliarcobacter butzleri 7h1h]|uniref:DUF2326 domain-containing protein n=1 Tax=Aliarcobacter butzleri TaxID=28197 RepID=UPI0002D74773|nr:DUF2326 domain-containing protein [Aliarcobacter butzleri]AGR77662.1 hypothetical protein A7H1H_1375 [Aliarcobacter butzleri 7h1h]MCG3665175.1 DUF2326 domain-containing protein [Aliarcobacter butzleri]
MLVEIKSDVFREKIIKFHSGLNIVLGDEKASNSIGKSNLLLIIDFIFGGDTYISHSKDVIEQLGEHSFSFCFKFEKKYKFIRTVENSKIVSICDENYNINDAITIDEFTRFLQEKYNIDYTNSTFRSLVGTYSRIWGKNNYTIDKPLKTYENDAKDKNGIDNLIKLFNRYDELNEINEKLKNESETNKVLNNMFKYRLAPKVTKKEYSNNIKQIESLKKEIKNIEDNVLKYVLNIQEIINKEVLDLKNKKNYLLSIKDNLDNQKLRINNNLEKDINLDSKYLKMLGEFFPNSNIQEIDKIEGFHKKIKTILFTEIKNGKEIIEAELENINNNINEIDTKIEESLNQDDNPKHIVNRIHDLTLELNTLESNNKFYKDSEDKRINIKIMINNLSEKINLISSEIRNKINLKMLEINRKVYLSENSPIFNIENYKYLLSRPNDTGTGTGEGNLIIFDLAVFELTGLPFLIHDTVVFKDIGIEAMEKFIELYNTDTKQIFMSLDEYKKYVKVLSIIEDRKVIKLDKHNTLFIKIWNKDVKK